MADVSTSRLFDGSRLKKLREWIEAGSSLLAGGGSLIEFLRGFDLTKLKPAIDSFFAIAKAPDLKGKVLAGLNTAKLFAEITATESDDKLVATIDTIINSGPWLDWINNIIATKETQVSAAGLSFTVLSHEEFSEGMPSHSMAIDIAAIWQIVQFVWMLIQSLRKPASESVVVAGMLLSVSSE